MNLKNLILNKRNQKKMYIVQNSIYITFQKIQIIVTEIKLVVSWGWECLHSLPAHGFSWWESWGHSCGEGVKGLEGRQLQPGPPITT